ncbi:hypothetical protein PTSG_04789 [Salpingoeca rosetta]|uniref:B box-type domain-containing protein n=1 Tax=Salpingoeca rosetta (strain ATCC 50818 / BSB-021) TaxID=946362 RepID=F2U9P7_SALR5|nr:uncharacterized protein PTSG_04789 [Salpingoeca rosetta]EGD73074.1 hypothetical protein PTSG_04789 [Salpingoeca rosetta]|eukprot:XP_004994105.1 hypothetical protein PTSG_04789 [Salpingoeca rosetta]
MAESVSGDVPNCSNCEDELALLFCEECEEHFCRECGEVLHKSAKRRTHNLRRIQPKQRSSEDILNDMPDLSLNGQSMLMSTDSQGSIDLDKTITAPDPSSLPDWTLQDVASWLASQSPAYADYAAAFQNNHIRGRVLPLLDSAALAELGVDAADQDSIIAAITRLQLEHEKSVVNTMLAEFPRAAM